MNIEVTKDQGRMLLALCGDRVHAIDQDRIEFLALGDLKADERLIKEAQSYAEVAQIIRDELSDQQGGSG